jgi:hypothetical protein
MQSQMRRFRYPNGLIRDRSVDELAKHERVYQDWLQSQQELPVKAVAKSSNSSNSSSSSAASAQQSSSSGGTSKGEELFAKGGDAPSSSDTSARTVTAPAAKAVVPAVNSSSSSSSVVAQQSSSSSSSTSSSSGSASGRAKAKKRPGDTPLLKATAATGGAKAAKSSVPYPIGGSVYVHLNGSWLIANVSKQLIHSVCMYACMHSTH